MTLTDRQIPKSTSTPSEPPMPSPSAAQISLGLERISSLLHNLSSPHLRVPIVHVAGTNGKGSTCAYLSSILHTSGYTVGRFNSPHLVEPRDSIAINGLPISASEYAQRTEQVESADREHGTQATEFEKLTAAAYLTFAEHRNPKVDVAVVEVGMGGLGDATNVCPAGTTLASGITPVELDHQAFLGNTVRDIATVKAGIVKPRTPVVVACQAHPEAEEAVLQAAAAQGSDVYFVAPGGGSPPPRPGDPASVPLTAARSSPGAPSLPQPLTPSIFARLSLQGAFQLPNAAHAALLAQTLASHPHPLSLLPSLQDQITPLTIVQGLKTAKWPGRLTWLTLPLEDLRSGSAPAAEVQILVDGAHNPSAAQALGEYLASLPPAPLTLVLGLSAPREPAALLDPLLAALQRGDGSKGGSGRGTTTAIATSFSPVEGMPWVTPVPCAQLVEALQKTEGLEPLGYEHDVEAAVRRAVILAAERGGGAGRVVVLGSLYLVADVFRWARRLGQQIY